jgi:hypothetical protein
MKRKMIVRNRACPLGNALPRRLGELTQNADEHVPDRQKQQQHPRLSNRTLKRSLATLVLFSVVLGAAASADATKLPPPPPPPKFWTANRCERTLLRYPAEGGSTVDGRGFHVGLAICVGTGGPHACKWTTDHRSRLYSRFIVFSRARWGTAVRSFILATRGGPGLVANRHIFGDRYVGWPADYYMSPASVKLLATNASPARFRSIVAPIAAHLTLKANATACTGR